MAQIRFYLYLTLGSKVKVKWMSWWYATHRLMVMHPHTKYHWVIFKGKKVMARTSVAHYFAFIWPWGQRSRSNECHNGTRHIVLWSYTHIPSIIDLSLKTKKLWPGQASLRMEEEEEEAEAEEEEEAEEKIRLKQYVSLHSEGET